MGLIEHNSAVTEGERLHGHRITYSLDTLDHEAGQNDLFFHYAYDFRDESLNTNMLTLPVIDSELFSPPAEPVERRKSYLYLHRHPLRDVDF
nr:hypothetical protein [Tanacetum cinerariifolium]